MHFGDLIVRPFKKTLALGLWETATCFAARISTLFPSSSAEEFWHTVGLPFHRIAAGDREAIKALAHFTAADEAALLRSSPQALGKSYLRIGDEIITTQDYVRGSYPICPACAEEDIAARPDLNPDQAVFGRLEWHATSVRTCRRHQRSLVDARADLTVGSAYHDFGFRTSSALNDLSSLRATSVERPTTPYEDYFVQRLQGGGEINRDPVGAEVASGVTRLSGVRKPETPRPRRGAIEYDGRREANSSTGGFLDPGAGPGRYRRSPQTGAAGLGNAAHEVLYAHGHAGACL